METALHGLAAQAKANNLKEAVAQARETLKNESEKHDTPLCYLREKLLSAFEIAFENGNEKAQHYAIEGLQHLLRDKRFHSEQIENPQNGLPTQVLHSLTSISHWNHQVQCHCLTVIVELICSAELKITLSELQEAIEICIRVFTSSKEETARMSARAAISQSMSSYFSNRYNQCEEPQDFISVYLQVTSLLEGYMTKLDQLTAGSEQSLVLFDATNALLAAQPLSIQTHQPFVNMLWEKLCPLMIRLLGVPDRNVTSSSFVTPSPQKSDPSTVPGHEEPMGQGQMAKFALCPAVLANPEVTRAMYLIVEQLFRFMGGIPSVSSVLEALFHKAFLFPKIEQRSEAIKIIRKMLCDPRRLADLVLSSCRTNSLSLWRMLVVCMAESSNPAYDISIEAVRACSSMLQGMIDFCNEDKLLSEETEAQLREMFPSLRDIKTNSFLPLSREISVVRSSTDEKGESENTGEKQTVRDEEEEDEMSDCLQRLTSRFKITGESAERMSRASTDSIDRASETATATRFVDVLCSAVDGWNSLKSTIAVDEAIHQFATQFYNDFSATHQDLFKRKSRVQQEFLNTDALYLTCYSALSLAYRGEDTVTWISFKESILHSGCIIYASETWLKQVYELVTSRMTHGILGTQSCLIDVIKDYDGLDNELLSDVVRLKRISDGPKKEKLHEERLAARWLICSAWDSIVCILNTFIGVKDRQKARQKVLEGIEHSVMGMQRLATVAMELELGDRCGWIFENLVESSCDLEQLRTIASAEENKRLSVVSRVDLLSIQLVLDNAYVAMHSVECWKHVIRCTEFVWELEKFIYGAMCYEKPTKSMFFSRKVEEKTARPKDDEGTPAADRTVENAIGDRSLDKESINRALCVLIAKADRFYSSVGRELPLRCLRLLVSSICSASENRILYSSMPNSPSLTPSVNLIGRLSECLASLASRPLVHQMLVWPIAGRHFVQVACGSEDESRCAVSSLQECTRELLTVEGAGSNFNQMLLAPFQAIVCSDRCSTETRAQLVECLSEFVHLKADRVGSGWKPLFGALRAVRTSDGAEDGLHWTVLDVIGTYLGIKKSSVLSFSLPDCLPCIVHFLQSTHSGEGSGEETLTSMDEQLSSAALKLVKPAYSVVLNLYTTPHIPNPGLLHKMELRATSSEEVESRVESLKDTVDLLPPLSASLDPTYYLLRPDDPSPIEMDKSLDVPPGQRPWELENVHQVAALELLCELVEQLSGVLVTAPATVQSPLLSALSDLIVDIRKSEIGTAPAAFCVSSLLLPHVQKWMRRSLSTQDARNNKQLTKNLKHAIGICAELAVDFVSANPGGTWEIRLLSDVLRLATECAALPSDASRVGAACLRHFESVFDLFEFAHWTIFTKAIWDSCSVTLHPLRLLLSFFLSDSSDINGDLGEVLIEGAGNLPIEDQLLAEQVFLVDSQRETTARNGVSDEKCGNDLGIVLIKDEKKYRLSVSHLISSLLAHQVILQLTSSLLAPPTEVPQVLKGVLCSSSPSNHIDRIPSHCRTSLYHCLDASQQASRDLDHRDGLRSLLKRVLHISDPNLYKQMVSAGCVKMFSMFYLAEKRMAENDDAPMRHFASLHAKIVEELERVERKTADERMGQDVREHREEKFEFLLVEGEVSSNGEKLYRLVSQDQIKDTINEYKKQRLPGGLPPKKVETRKNPFVAAMSQERKSADGKEPPSLSTLRLLSLRELSLLPVSLSLHSPLFSQSFPILLPSLSRLIRASPDLCIRSMATNYIEKLATLVQPE